MAKVLDLKKTVFDLVTENPEVGEVLASVGLKDVLNPAVLESVGKQFTIKEGVANRGADLEKVLAAFKEKGFEVQE